MTDESATVQREEKEKIMVLRNLFDFQISEISGNLETNFSIANVSRKLIKDVKQTYKTNVGDNLYQLTLTVEI